MTHSPPRRAAFEEDPPRQDLHPEEHPADVLLLQIEGYEGPIDVLLQLARDQKVDLAKISILQLARQYLAFVERARALRLDLAADYLVMAAWLAYLKSRMLLPDSGSGSPESSAAEMAEALQFQLRRLESVRAAAESLWACPRLGHDVFARGMRESFDSPVTLLRPAASLYDLLHAYGDFQRRQKGARYDLPGFSLMSMESAMERLTTMLGRLPRHGPFSVWTTLHSFLPESLENTLYGRSALASTFTAGLELAKQGQIELRQDAPFRPIYLRQIPPSRKSDSARDPS